MRKTLNVIIGCELSGVIRNAFRRLGHNAFSCDLEPPDDADLFHLQMDVFEALEIMEWDLAILHPPCTYLTVTANKWYKDQPPRKSGALVGKERREARDDAVKFFMRCANTNVPYVAVENPVGIISTRWRKPDQIIQPFEYGHKEPKKTCLWLKNLPELVPTKIVSPEYHTSKSGKRMPKWYAYADQSKGQKHRAKIRSQTFQGVADAMAFQWSNHILKEINGTK